MTKEQILKKAIEKAEKNGWKKRNAEKVVVETEQLPGIEEIGIKPDTFEHIYFVNPKRRGGSKVEIDLENLIFSHDFAKAFFKESKFTKELGVIAWKYHLGKMVLEENPILYLERFL